jgi:2-oxoglutarate ferredoxin oxidoreductase subunit beta
MVLVKKPKSIISPGGFCGGCGHGIIMRLIGEVIEELGLDHKTINVGDIACCYYSMDAMNFDAISGPHGRCPAIATAIKKVRPESNVFVIAGDGASYTIGFLETSYAALRDIPITMVVVNNTTFGMTGGQMAPGTTPLNEKTVTTPLGRDATKHGKPMDFLQVIAQYDIEFAARGAVFNVAEINKTKKLLKKAFENQRDNKGFSIVEILSACPTNWGMNPIEANEKVKNDLTQVFPIKEFINRGQIK